MHALFAFCQTDPGLREAIYMIACRDLAVKQQHHHHPHHHERRWSPPPSRRQEKAAAADDEDVFYEQRALYYRGECIRRLCEAMPGDGRPVTDNVICMAMFLAFSEVGQFLGRAGGPAGPSSSPRSLRIILG